MVLVLSEADESEYVISNVLSNVLVLNYEFQSKWPEHTRHVNEPFARPAYRFCAFAAGSRSVNSMISAFLKGEKNSLRLVGMIAELGTCPKSNLSSL